MASQKALTDLPVVDFRFQFKTWAHNLYTLNLLSYPCVHLDKTNTTIEHKLKFLEKLCRQAPCTTCTCDLQYAFIVL